MNMHDKVENKITFIFLISEKIITIMGIKLQKLDKTQLQHQLFLSMLSEVRVCDIVYLILTNHQVFILKLLLAIR